MAEAAAIKVLSAGAAEGPLSELIPRYMQETGRKVAVGFGTVGSLRDRFKAGEAVDVIVLSAPAIAALEKEGGFLSGSVTLLGQATTGVAMKVGARQPDITTPEAFKAALLNARSVGATDPAKGGSSGIYLAALMERMGIADAMRNKMVLGNAGRDVAAAVVSGEAELGITFISEFLPFKDLAIVGPLPKEMEYVNGYTAAIAARSQAVDDAQAFLSYLKSPAAREVFKRAGLE